jgi:hypothetical protein
MLHALLLDHLKDPESSWSCGRFGAIAEFHRDADEPAALAEAPALSAVTARGAIRIDTSATLRPIAYETISKCIDSWGHGVALCLPRDEARMSGRTLITELGPDREALRPEDRHALLFDLGLGGSTSEICVRSADPETIALLREACGKVMFDCTSLLSRLPALSPHRVFISRMGRVEVYQPIPPPTGKSPDGPHTHVLPRLLERGRSHAATVPIPAGWVGAMTLYPPHPLRHSSGRPIAFDVARHAAFQTLMDLYGAPAQVAGKRAAARNEKAARGGARPSHRPAPAEMAAIGFERSVSMSKRPLLGELPDTTRRIVWIVFLTVASRAFSRVFACAAPFAALATLAALNVRRPDAYILTVLVWLANQAVGYGLLNYPRTSDSVAWGIAIGIAALLATHTVIALGPRPLRSGPIGGAAVGFLAAFVVYEVALYAAAFVLPSSDAAFSLATILYVLKVNVAGLAVLVALSFGARAIGLARPVPIAADRQ